MGKFYLALDIGGTKTSAALFNQEGKIVDNYVTISETQTFKDQNTVYQNVKATLLKVIEHHDYYNNINMRDIIGIGVGSPGPLDRFSGTIVHAPLMRWKNFPIVKQLSDDFSKKVLLDNDGNLGAFAEQRCGVAKGLKNILYMTVSTGCGGGILINGEIYHGANDAAGEVGHMCIEPNGLDCPCGSKGCFELYASGTALLNFMKRDMRYVYDGKSEKNEKNGKNSKVFDLASYDPEKLNGRLLTQAAEENDAYALELYRKEGYYLGIGISNLINLFDPEAVVLGGGVAKASKFFSSELYATLVQRCLRPPKPDFIRYSELNDYIILYGAYYMIKESL